MVKELRNHRLDLQLISVRLPTRTFHGRGAVSYSSLLMTLGGAKEQQMVMEFHVKLHCINLK